jgi:peptidyl-prolyl cis-trans isomerase-like protein 2
MLAFVPFENPVATKQGHVFDLLNIVPYLRQHKKNPMTGERMSAKDLVHLKFHKNKSGKYMCPITYKEFNDNT